MKVKVLSLLQPWASLSVTGDKRIETRSWQTKYRGELYIHASAKEFKPIHGQEKLLAEMTNCGFWDKCKKMPYGAIIGKVNLLDIIRFDLYRRMIEENMSVTVGYHQVDFSEKEVAFGDFGTGRFGWLLSDPIMFAHPIPCKGSLSVWEYDLPEQFEYPLPEGGVATFDTPPDQATWAAVVSMQTMAKKLKAS